jgi:hypothetical protein
MKIIEKKKTQTEVEQLKTNRSPKSEALLRRQKTNSLKSGISSWRTGIPWYDKDVLA